MGGLPKTIHLYTREFTSNQFPIGKIDTLGGLNDNNVSFKVKRNADNPNFVEDLEGNCLKEL